MDDFIFQGDDVLNQNAAQNASITIMQDGDENYDYDPYAYRSLSDVQKTILDILPIPSAVLSIFGSSIIIYMAYLSRKSRPWTPYNRLLVGMSVFDIITSIALASAAFSNPKETSNKALAMGNDSTCSAMGFFNQISYSGTLYNASLSFYFLFTARFGMKNAQIARRIEPTMHIFNVGFPLITGFIGLFVGVYGEPEVGVGCWVNRYPKRCGYGPDGTDEPCLSVMISWVFGAWVAMGTLVALIVNNFVIWIFVRRKIKKGLNGRVRPSGLSSGGSLDLDEDNKGTSQSSFASSLRTRTNLERSSSQHSLVPMNRDTVAAQRRRLRLVSSQAFLFVASYIVCSASTYLLRYFESTSTSYVMEMELPYHNYILMVLQAVFLPLQGLFNMLVYVRPKYLKSKIEFPNESKSWAFHRAIRGSKVEPTHSLHGTVDINKRDSKGDDKAAHHQALGKDMISSLTNGSAGGGGGNAKDDDETEEDEAPDPPMSCRRKVSGSNSLDVISEIEEPEDSGYLSAAADGQQQGARHVGNPSSRIFDTNKGSASVLMDGSILQSPRPS